jgi:PAS domain S-box-containing protein
MTSSDASGAAGPVPPPVEQFVRAVVDALPQPVFAKDQQLRFVYVNAAFAAATGRDPSALLGKTDYDVFPPPEAELARRRDTELFATGTGVHASEELVADRDGRVRVLSTTVVPLRAAGGEVTHLIGIVHDITQLKEQERALRVFNEELEQLVGARTAQLRRAQQELLKKERLAVVGQLSAGLAHQLRNPLASITNAASVVEQRLLRGKSEEASFALAIIREEVVAANRIITDLLDYARVRPPRPTHVFLGELVETAYDAQALPSGVRVVRDVPDELALQVDADQLRTALRNVVRNSVEAMPRGGTLTIAAERSADGVRIRIFDTGDGVPAALREQIFDPLVSSKPYGIGLGLTTARALIENQGGSLRCEARAESGTEMVVDLPFLPTPGAGSTEPP